MGGTEKQGSFNPRTHTGCDVTVAIGIYGGHKVSIHAPTRGATKGSAAGTIRQFVSIHAPTRGATELLNAQIQ